MIRKYSQHVLREDIDIQYGLLIRSRIVALIRLQAHAQNVQKYYAAQKKTRTRSVFILSGLLGFITLIGRPWPLLWDELD